MKIEEPERPAPVLRPRVKEAGAAASQFIDFVRRGDAEGGEGSFIERDGGFYDDSYEYDVDGEGSDFLRRRCLPEEEEDAAEAEAEDRGRAEDPSEEGVAKTEGSARTTEATSTSASTRTTTST